MSQIVEIAKGFPPGLNTANAPTDIDANESPDCYGINVLQFDKLSKGAIPSGTSRVVKTFTIDAAIYNYYYGRLWNISGNVLNYGAPGFINTFYRQNSGIIAFDEDDAAIVTIVPFGADSMLVAKSTGSYVLSNCADNRAFFQRTDIIQGLKCAASTYATTINGNLYVSNAYGLMGWEAGKLVEHTAKVRDDVTNFSNVALTLDHEHGLVIGGTKFVLDTGRGSIYRFDGSNFRYTTPQIRNKNYEPFSVECVLLRVKHDGEDDGSITFQIKHDDGNWSEEFNATLPFVEEQYAYVTIPLELSFSCQKWQMRITDITGNKAIKSIAVEANNYRLWDYSR